MLMVGIVLRCKVKLLQRGGLKIIIVKVGEGKNWRSESLPFTKGVVEVLLHHKGKRKINSTVVID